MAGTNTDTEEPRIKEIAVANTYPGTVIKIIQINIVRGRVAHYLAMATAIKWEMDMVLMGECNDKLAAAAGLQVLWKKDVAIGIIGKHTRINQAVDPGRGFICTKVNGINL